MQGGAHTELGPGTVLKDKWRLDSLLSRGRAGEVFAATHRNSRRFAIKVLDRRISADPVKRAALVRRCYIANAIPHEGVIHALDDDETADGWVFLVMDLVEGENLHARWLREGRKLRPSQVVELALGTLDVLASSHERGIVHGALSLDHVLLSRTGTLRLCGFGAAFDPDLVEPAVTLPVDVGGGPFVAPEQVKGGADTWTTATDVFGVAAMACTLLTGAYSLEGGGDPLRRSLPSLAPAVAAVLDKAISVDSADRYLDAAAMRAALEAAVTEAVRVKTGPRSAEDDRAFAPGGPTIPSTEAPFHDAPSDSGISDPHTFQSGAPSAPAPSLGKRATTILVVTGLDAPRARELRERATAARFRIEMVLGSSAIVLPPAFASGREDAYEVAAFALAVSRTWPDLPVSVVRGVDILTDQEGANTPLKHALARTPALGLMPPIRLDHDSARILEQFFRVTNDAESEVLSGELPPESGARRLLGRPTVFVGREKESEDVGAIVSEAFSASRAAAAVVVAGAGIGKSRLVEEIVGRVGARHAGADVWAAVADPIRKDAAFGLVAQLVCHAAGTSRDDAPEERARAVAARVASAVPNSDAQRVALFLGELVGAGAGDGTSRELEMARRDAAVMGDQVRFAFLDFVNGASTARPLCVVVEDLQWSDAASVELLGHALSILGSRPWAIVATARPSVLDLYPELWKARCTTLALSPLGRTSLQSIAEAAEAAGLAHADVEKLVDGAAGNPLLLEETIRARMEGCYQDAISVDLAGVVRARFDALDAGLRRVLSAASVFGSSFSLAGAQALLGASAQGTAAADSAEHPSRVAAKLEELCRRELLFVRPRRRGTTEFAFRHALVREVAYEGLVRERRPQAHRAAGTFLEQSGERESAVLAEHFSRGNAEVQAAAWYERSATVALERSDVTRALDLAERGLAYRPQIDVTLSLLAVKAECHAWRADYQKAKEAARKVIEGTDRKSLLFSRALPTLAISLTRGGDPEGSVALAHDLLANPVPVADKRALAAAMTPLVAYLLRIGRSDLVRVLMERLADLGSEPGADPGTVANVESARSWCAMFAGDFSECLRHDREVVKRFAEARDLRSACHETTSIGYDFMVLGAYEEAEAAFRTALSTAERLGIVRVVASAKHHLSLVTLRLGRLDEAHQFAIEALEIGKASPDPFALGSMRTYLALVLMARGDEVGASKNLLEAIELFAPTPSSRSWPLAELARVRLLEGNKAEALESAEAAMNVVAATGPAEEGDAVIRLTHAEALEASGRFEEAKKAIELAARRLHERADRISDPSLKASFLRRVPEHALTLAAAARMGIAETAR